MARVDEVLEELQQISDLELLQKFLRSNDKYIDFIDISEDIVKQMDQVKQSFK
jgi:hypothetical protein